VDPKDVENAFIKKHPFKNILTQTEAVPKQNIAKYISDGINLHLFFDTNTPKSQTLAAFKTTDRQHLDSCTDR